MTTGYEAGFYREFSVLLQAVRSLDGSLNRIANCMEADEKRKRRQDSGGWAPVVKDPLDMFTEEGPSLREQAELILQARTEEFTTPEDVEKYGRAVKAVREGFADLQAYMKEQ